MRRTAALLLGGALLLTACSDFGTQDPGTPLCPAPGRTAYDTPIVILMQLQAAVEARFGPCINRLEVGWEYEAQEAERGRVTFWLDSDRMGSRFAEVTLQRSCDPDGAAPAPGPTRGVQRFVEVLSQSTTFELTIVPVAPRHLEYAALVAAVLQGAWQASLPLAVDVVDPTTAASVQIESMMRRGSPVIVIDDREAASSTVELRVPGEEVRAGLDPREAAVELMEDLAPPHYRATWFNLFDGGCIVYRINARGEGAQTVATDLDASLGFYPLAQLREAARSLGYDI